MYLEFFSLKEQPFSISPDPDFLFLSDRHREALAHLSYGLQNNGGFVLLTGEVGTGKTTVCRFLLQNMPKEVDVAFILNPALTEIELLATICDEFHLEYQHDNISLKSLFDTLTAWMSDNHLQGKSAVVVIDEAQHLSFSVLEQLRLLTNIESKNKKALQVILIGQTELQEKLKQQELRQLAQRITVRYHLLPLTEKETAHYIQHRLNVAGALYPIFDLPLQKKIFKHSQGIPRLINFICDRCMLCAYSENTTKVSPQILKSVIKDIDIGELHNRERFSLKSWGRLILFAFIILITGILLSKAVDSTFVANMVEKALAVSAPAQPIDIKKAEQKDEAMIVVDEITNDTQYKQVSIVDTDISNNEFSNKKTPVSDMMDSSEKEENQYVKDKVEGAWFDDYPQLDLSQREFPHALKNLYAIWGYQVDLAKVSCNKGSAASLLCFSASSNINKLRQFNYPGVIKLINGDEYIYAVIYKILDDYQLIIGEQSIHVSENWLQRYWNGGLTLLWKAPFLPVEHLKFGQQGEQVAWLNLQLNNIYSLPATDNDRFDSSLLQRVQQFQHDHSLIDDGIVGERTLMLIMQRANPSLPRLIDENL